MEKGAGSGLGIMVSLVIMSIMLGLVVGWRNYGVGAASFTIPRQQVEGAVGGTNTMPPLPEEPPFVTEQESEESREGDGEVSIVEPETPVLAPEEDVADEDADYYVVDSSGNCKNGKGRSPGNGKPGNCSQNGYGHNTNNGNNGNNGNGNNGNNGNGNNDKGNKGNNGNNGKGN